MRLRRPMIYAVAGLLAFSATQYALIATAGSNPAMEGGPGWFLNTGTSLAILMAAVALASAATAILVPEPFVLRGALAFAGGASVSMAVALMIIGPGNIFPIVMAIGVGFIVIAAVIGGTAGALLRRMAGRVP